MTTLQDRPRSAAPEPGRRPERKKKARGTRAFLQVFLIGTAIVWIFPVAWALYNSFRDYGYTSMHGNRANSILRMSVERRIVDERRSAGIDCIRAPRDGSLFLISNVAPDLLLRKYRWFSWANLGGFCACVSALALCLAFFP